MKRLAIIQARMSSSRMPGKVLEDLDGLPLIVFMARRVQRARSVDQLIVATSTDASDDPLANVLERHGIECFRGDLADVLDRFCQAARGARADYVVRLTGDCPLMDADLVDSALAELASGRYDYVSNVEPPTHPDGISVEAFTMAALETAWKSARLASEREHVTPWMRKKENGLRSRNLPGFFDLAEMRWTVDYPDDLRYVRALVAAMKVQGRQDYDRFDLYRAIETQGIAREVAHSRYEGYSKSLAEDHVVALPGQPAPKP